MSFLDTVPAAIDQLDHVGPWERFKNSDPRQCLAALREACHADTPLTLGAPDGPSLTASLWAIDEAAGRLHFNVNGKTREAAAVAALPVVWAAMYQGDVKLQFLLRDTALGHLAAGRRVLAGATRSLVSELPTAMYALPRRQTVRVRRAEQGPPELRFVHPFAPEQPLQLQVLDISVTGCAVRKPAGVLPLLPGTCVRSVEVELDSETVLFTDMTVQHVTLATADPAGSARVGCRWHAMPESAQETLAHWIAGGRRRRDLVSISFD
jgi:hypothetical protein